MDFTSETALKNYILSHSEIAIMSAQEKIYQIINKNLKKFYDEYSPSVYERTEQLLRSLVKSDVKKIGNQFIAEVYFDLDALDYSVKYLYGKFYNNKFHGQNWTHENDAWVLQNAMTGTYPHGGYNGATGNTRIWLESMAELTSKMHDILKNELIAAGIPVK